MTWIEDVAAVPLSDRVPRLVDVGRRILGGAQVDDAGRERLIALLVEAVEAGAGSGKQRLDLGEVLGLLGDPRLHLPADPDYWVHVPSDHGDFALGRFLVTNHEFTRWVEAGGYEDQTPWSEEGWAWLRECEDPWPVRARAEGSEPFVVPNQPVVGVTWYEAEAYARAMGARLPRADERVWAIRGRERRPYPWGSPFGEGNANTREEVLGRPCAVGLYPKDKTPEGIYDLAGNVAEWTADGVGAERLTHPGAWDQPSLAAWAKALSMAAPDNRWSGLGFRLARDA